MDVEKIKKISTLPRLASIGDRDLIVIDSQAALGQFPDAPEELLAAVARAGSKGSR